MPVLANCGEQGVPDASERLTGLYENQRLDAID
jgi:hypothetical protein